MSGELDNALASDHDRIEPLIRLTPSEKNMIAGGVAGCIAKTVVAPLSRLTVLSQVSSLFPKQNAGGNGFSISHKANVLETLRSIAKHQGVWSLWNGNLTSVIHRFPYSAINFAVFETANGQMSKITGNHDAPANRFIAGALSGAAACTACYPLDLIRTRLTVANSFGPEPVKGGVKQGGKIYALIKDIITKEGIAGLYRGLPVSIFVTAPNLAISFSIYGFVKGKLMALGGMFTYEKKDALGSAPHLTPLGSLCSGCLSGIASSCVIFPIDVIRKRMQVMGQLVPHSTEMQIGQEIIESANANTLIEAIRKNEMSGIHIENGSITSTTNTTHTNINIAKAKCTEALTLPATAASSKTTTVAHNAHYNSSSWQQATHIYRTDGIRGFYRGLAPELLKVCPMVAIMYCSYEIVQDHLNEHFPSPEKRSI